MEQFNTYGKPDDTLLDWKRKLNYNFEYLESEIRLAYSRFRQVKTVVPETFASTTINVANTFNTTGFVPVTIVCSTGTMYINPTTVATVNNGFKMNEGDVFDLIVPDTLSTLSTSLASAYQAIIWQD